MRLFNLIKKKFYYIIFIILVIFSSIFAYNSLKNYLEYYKNRDYGFVITRHVKCEETNLLWLASVKQIQKFYPQKKIVIIDDNSNYEHIKNVKNIDLSNCIIIDSEFKGSGELLPYYYFCKNKWFDKMIFIHDSVFLNTNIDVNDIKDVKFLWHFNNGEGMDDSLNNNIERLIRCTNTKYTNELIDLFKTDKWKGCWGVMSIITNDYVVYLFNKYNLTELVNHVKNRQDRMSLERLFGLICCFENDSLTDNIDSVYGDYSNNNTLTGNTKSTKEYLKDIDDDKLNTNTIKLFFGR